MNQPVSSKDAVSITMTITNPGEPPKVVNLSEQPIVMNEIVEIMADLFNKRAQGGEA